MLKAVLAVFGIPCATPGDFIVKSYVNLLWHAGHTKGREVMRSPTGSFHDIDLSEIDSDSTITDAYYGAVYDDLDQCDLGACLLATGNIDFDPRGWLERADTIGMPVAVILKADGSKSLSFGFIDNDDDRLRREERRLQQILTFDHARRWQSIAAYISEHRADLLLVAPAPAAQVSA
ncbi:hypothetical protein GR702_09110 [Novosphingobium sp. FGD1]|uniref:Uncharacterized protein n=1 Tax=Novosphingobium silvae TaxID=2692619 RepID=A0A7X4K772_9SPHN|nr:hypothetical protein [Novosphingobium silvae]MYL97929.1 hypothetical protein [Novosphingobium silvae]